MLVLPWLRGSPPHCPLPPPRTSLTVEVKAFYSKLAWKFPFSLFWHHPAGWVGSPCYSLARLLGSTGVGLGLWCSTGVMWLSPEKHWVFLSSFLFFFFFTENRLSLGIFDGIFWHFWVASFSRIQPGIYKVERKSRELATFAPQVPSSLAGLAYSL